MGLACTCVLCTPRIYNGLCMCRGWDRPHPFHNTSTTTGGSLTTPYVGKHRKPEE